MPQFRIIPTAWKSRGISIFSRFYHKNYQNWLISEGEVCWTTVRVHTVTCSSLQHTESLKPVAQNGVAQRLETGTWVVRMY